MSLRDTPPFRADHVGSLLRPPELTRARADFKAGLIDANDLRRAEDAAILEVMELQRAVGLRSVTDGELRRTSWHMDFIYQLGGIHEGTLGSSDGLFRDQGGGSSYAAPIVGIGGTITLPQTIFADAFTFVRDNASSEQTAKLTIPSPSMVHYRGGDSIDPSVYPDLDQFWEDLTEAYSNEVRGVYELGCRYLQLDDTALAHVCDPAQRSHIAQIGGDPDHLHEQYIAAINRVLEAKPDDLVVTTHLCRGNNQSRWASEGGYDPVAEALFGQLKVDAYFLEYDDDRSGTFDPLRYVTDGKLVVLGLITSKRPELESKDLLKRRIEVASKFVDIDDLCLSPQCGFSSTEEGNQLTIDAERAKLELVVEVADEVWR